MFLPLVLIGIFCLLLFFVKVNNSSKYEKTVEYHKDTVDESIKKKLEQEQKLASLDKKLKKKQEIIKKKVKEDEDHARKVISRIQIAASTADVDELKRIQSELRERSASRRTRKP